MNDSLQSRLNIAHVAVVRAGTSRPTGWLDDQIIGIEQEEQAPTAPAPIGKKPRRKKLTAEQAKKMADDLEGYDSKIVGGRLT